MNITQFLNAHRSAPAARILCFFKVLKRGLGTRRVPYVLKKSFLHARLDRSVCALFPPMYFLDLDVPKNGADGDNDMFDGVFF